MSRQIAWYVLSYLCVSDLSQSSVHLWGMYYQTHTTLANYSSWRLHPSLQCTMPIQTKRSDECVKNRKLENRILLLNYDVFWCKNIDNIISGPQRTVQNKKIKKQRQFMTPLRFSTQPHTHIQCIQKVFRPPSHFLIFLCCSLILQLFKLNFLSLIYTLYLNDKVKKIILEMSVNLLKRKT